MDKGGNDKDISEDEVEEGWHKEEKEPYCALGEVWKKYILVEFFTMQHLKLTINTSLF